MLMIEGIIAAFAWAMVGLVVLVSLDAEDIRDGTLMLLLSTVTLGASIYSADSTVALALKVLLAMQAMFVIGWVLRRRWRRR